MLRATSGRISGVEEGLRRTVKFLPSDMKPEDP